MSKLTNAEKIINSIHEEEVKTVKKRGRPSKKVEAPKTQQHEEEVIVKIHINKEEIQQLEEESKHDLSKDKGVSISINENEHTLIEKLKKYKMAIKQLKQENDELKEHIRELQPMFYSEVKDYSRTTLLKSNNCELEPRKINGEICCLNCTIPIDGYPVYLIYNYINRKYIIMGDGNDYLFCSFNCYLSYCHEYHRENIEKHKTLIKSFYREMHDGDEMVNILPAEHRKVLTKFGGKVTEEEYKKKLKFLDRKMDIGSVPFVPTPSFIKEIKTATSYYINNNPNSTKTREKNNKE